MQLPLPHNKWVLIGLVGAAVALGLYLRSRNASTDATASSDSTDPTDPLSDINDPYSSGSYDNAGGGVGNGDSQYPYPASGPPITIKLVPPGTTKKSPAKKRTIYGRGKNGKPFYSKEAWNIHLAEERQHKGAGKHGSPLGGKKPPNQQPHAR